MEKSIFISHSSKDAKIAKKICEALENEGLRCWIAPRDIPYGVEWAGEISKAISASSAFLFLSSGNSNLSEHVTREIQLALKNGVTIIPIKLDDSDYNDTIGYYLATIHSMFRYDGGKTEKLVSDISHLLDAGADVKRNTLTEGEGDKNKNNKEKTKQMIAAGISVFIVVAFAVAMLTIKGIGKEDNSATTDLRTSESATTTEPDTSSSAITTEDDTSAPVTTTVPGGTTGYNPPQVTYVYQPEASKYCDQYDMYVSGYFEGQDYAKMRYGPRPDGYQVIPEKVIYNGGKVRVESVSVNGWTLVYSEDHGIEGWVKSAFLFKTYEECFNKKAVEPDSLTNDTGSYKVVIEQEYANEPLRMRSGPHKDYALVTEVANGEYVTVVGRSDSTDAWLYCSYKGHTGWLLSKYIEY